MNSRPSLYRSTLIAAAVAIGCCGAATAQAHDHGWRGHDEERGAYRHERGWQQHEWREHAWRERDGRRGDGPRYGYEGPAGWADDGPRAAGDRPSFGDRPGGASVVVRLPL